MPDRAERAELLGAVAAACEAAAEVDAAVELHLYAGRPRAALALLMQRYSDALPGSLTNEAKGARGAAQGRRSAGQGPASTACIIQPRQTRRRTCPRRQRCARPCRHACAGAASAACLI